MLPELYHAHHDLHREDMPFWLNLAAQTGGPILELGCGTGRVLIRLAQAGWGCVGLDRDLGMLHYLVSNLPPALKVKPQLVAADISRFALQEQFPLILLPCNTYSTLTTQQRLDCLSRVRRHLKPGGIFAASLPNPEIWDQLPARSDAEYEEEFILPHTGNPVQVSSRWRCRKKTFTIRWIYDLLLPDGTVKRMVMEAVHYRTPVNTYLDEIHSAGLEILCMYGDYDKSPYRVDSPSLIIVATTVHY